MTARPRPLYLRLWRGVPRELGYLVPTWIIALVVFNFLTAAIATGAGLIFLFVGIIIVSLVLIAARFLGSFELMRLRASGLPPIPEPRWAPPFAGKTFMRAIIDPLASAHHWLSYVHGAIANFLVALLTGVVTTAWIVTGLSLLFTPLWALITPNADGSAGYYGPNSEIGSDWNIGSLLTYGIFDRQDPSLVALTVTGSTVLGAILVALIPFITHGMTYAHWGAARVLLARFPSEDMSTEVAALAASQRAAVVAEDHSLRRLERDIHDGPQQRLMRLQMDLASAERRMADDPEQAVALMGSARALAQETLDELRALTQGFAPPLLQDRGLRAAIEALAARSSVPVDCRIELDRTLPSEIERGAYFIVTELLSNAVKHAEADAITLRVRTVEPAASGMPATLVLELGDDGRGGAVPVAGHGLVGLTERVAGLRGTLELVSPVGGPTRIVVAIPIPIAAAESASAGEPAAVELPADGSDAIEDAADRSGERPA